MGERLNIEIVNGCGPLANAYYHWSGFTDSALELTEKALEKYQRCARPNLQLEFFTALEMLENTGAALTPAELNAYKTLRVVENRFEGTLATLPERIDRTPNRNNGLIAISSYSMAETRCWQEERVIIDLSQEIIQFEALRDVTEYADEYETTKWPDVYCRWIGLPVPFFAFKEFSGFMRKLLEDKVYLFSCNGRKYAMIA